MSNASKDLLHLELQNPSSSSLESTLLVCGNASLTQNKKKPHPEAKPTTAPVLTSQVLGKVKDFLGVISEANERLQLDAKENSNKDYDIEVLTGNESEYIEMDLMLGVADLYTPEAVAAAESALAGSQPVISLADNSSGTDTEDSSDDESNSDQEEDDKNDDSTYDGQKAKSDSNSETSEPPNGESLRKPEGSCRSKKRSKIVEL